MPNCSTAIRFYVHHLHISWQNKQERIWGLSKDMQQLLHQIFSAACSFTCQWKYNEAIQIGNSIITIMTFCFVLPKSVFNSRHQSYYTAHMAKHTKNNEERKPLLNLDKNKDKPILFILTSQNSNMFFSSIPNSLTFGPLVDRATKCLATAESYRQKHNSSL